jgi:HSP20 family protein
MDDSKREQPSSTIPESNERNNQDTKSGSAEGRGIQSYGVPPSPFDLMKRFSDDVDRIFSSLGFGGRRRGPSWARPTTWGPQARSLARSATGTAWSPSVDISTEGDDLLVCVDLPGLKPEEIEIETADNQLIVRGEHRDEREQSDKEQGYRYTERSYGSFFRSIPLPPGIKAEDAQATFNNGVLQITVPGAARSLNPPRKRIPIAGKSQAQGEQPQPSEESIQGSQQDRPNFTDANVDTGTGTGHIATNPNTYDQTQANPS